MLQEIDAPKHEYYNLFGVYSRNFCHAKLDLTGKKVGDIIILPGEKLRNPRYQILEIDHEFYVAYGITW